MSIYFIEFYRASLALLSRPIAIVSERWFAARITGAAKNARAPSRWNGEAINRIEEVNEFGSRLPRLCVEGFGRDGDVSNAILTRRRWLDAAEAIFQCRTEGIKGDRAFETVGGQFGLQSEALRDAIKLHHKFTRELANPDSELTRDAAEKWGSSFDPADEDSFYFARSLFIAREAEGAVKWGRRSG